jgi:tetratricopeptide (TPR) repeat protein
VVVFGPDDEETLFPLTVLAFIRVARGDFASAEPVLRRVLALAERDSNGSSYLRAVAAGNLGFIYFVNRQYAMAQALFQKSLAGLEQNSIRAHDQIPLTQALLAGSYAAEGRRREANMWLERALAHAQQELRRDDPMLAVVFERGAVAKFCLKDYESGWKLFDRAIAVLEARYGPGSPPLLGALERYSSLLRLAKDKTRARQLEERRKAFTGKQPGSVRSKPKTAAMSHGGGGNKEDC